MLIISRKVGESILIDDNIEVIISDITHDKVKLAIQAPQQIKILRKELVETTRLNQEADQNIDPMVINKLLQAVKTTDQQ